MISNGRRQKQPVAVALVATALRRTAGPRAVAAWHEDLVTLDEAAQRTAGARSCDSLQRLARQPGFPAPRADGDGTAFSSWAEVAAHLRTLGDEMPATHPELLLANHALRTSYELDSANVPDTVRRALGL
ncbi:hypothetical protein [Streptomyces mayteni]